MAARLNSPLVLVRVRCGGHYPIVLSSQQLVANTVLGHELALYFKSNLGMLSTRRIAFRMVRCMALGCWMPGTAPEQDRLPFAVQHFLVRTEVHFKVLVVLSSTSGKQVEKR
jgi:hypothetical protein